MLLKPAVFLIGKKLNLGNSLKVLYISDNLSFVTDLKEAKQFDSVMRAADYANRFVNTWEYIYIYYSDDETVYDYAQRDESEKYVFIPIFNKAKTYLKHKVGENNLMISSLRTDHTWDEEAVKELYERDNILFDISINTAIEKNDFSALGYAPYYTVYEEYGGTLYKQIDIYNLESFQNFLSRVLDSTKSGLFRSISEIEKKIGVPEVVDFLM